jgi:hypothetical protein
LSIEMIPSSVRAEDQVLDLIAQKAQAVHLLRTLYLKFNESVALSKRYQEIDVELAIKQFESESNQALTSEVISFFHAIINLNDPNSLTKKLIGAGKEQLSLELPDNDEMKVLAQNLVQSWNLSDKIRHDTSIDWRDADEIAFMLSYYLTLVSMLWVSFQCIELEKSSGYAENPLRSAFNGWCDLNSRLGAISRIAVSPGSSIICFTIYFSILSFCLKKSYALKSGLISYQNRKSLNKLNIINQALIDQEAKKYDIPHLNLLISELINIRALARPAWNEDEQCPICLDSYQIEVQNDGLIDSDVEVTPCAHKFHKKCLEDVERSALSVNSSFNCPICRKIISSNNLPSESR